MMMQLGMVLLPWPSLLPFLMLTHSLRSLSVFCISFFLTLQDGVFVGSGIFKSENPAKRARAIVQAVTHYNNPKVLAEVRERKTNETTPGEGTLVIILRISFLQGICGIGRGDGGHKLWGDGPTMGRKGQVKKRTCSRPRGFKNFYSHHLFWHITRLLYILLHLYLSTFLFPLFSFFFFLFSFSLVFFLTVLRYPHPPHPDYFPPAHPVASVPSSWDSRAGGAPDPAATWGSTSRSDLLLHRPRYLLWYLPRHHHHQRQVLQEA